MVVDDVDVVADRAFELASRAVHAASDLSLGEIGEEPFDLVDPGRRGGREVDMPTQVPGQPPADIRRAVSAVIVHHQVYVEIGRDIGFDLAQEFEELAATMTGKALADHLARRHVEGGEQR